MTIEDDLEYDILKVQRGKATESADNYMDRATAK